ncbi:glycosyltransferase [Desulfuribacillus alkaliarsenatis]|uniref:Glycosyltransferase subfamily 4-like N-terminal domain-containing protein n=1 Tax=Desulfuribacillus alkaliarsenatis TaxID=766136 RepID=A0A1E5G1P1_9FIRM|nr:glycosyltransferase [Desulfuribacillus alkaliarsenatis]OEF96824.1 hypothetical protein BHF68_07125 [Desulfuribacillus alkaliarsenatis]
MQNHKVMMFVYNNFTHDTRVLKEAKTLTGVGYEVTIVAVLDDKTTPYEEIEGIRVIRVEKKPFHLRFLKHVREFTFKSVFYKLTKRVKGFINNKPDEVNKANNSKNIGFIAAKKREYNDAQAAIKQIGLKKYVKDEWRKNPKKLLLGLKGMMLLLYIFFRILKKVYTKAIQRPMKIIWARYVKKVYTKAIQRPMKIIWARYIKKAYRFGIYRPLYIIRHKYLKKIIHVVFIIPSKKVKNIIYELLKKTLLKFHKPFCFFDYYLRSYKLAKQYSADIYHAHDLNTLPVAVWASRKQNAKLIYDAHEFYVERNVKTKSRSGKILLTWAESYMIKKAHLTITVNEALANEFSKRYKIKTPSVIMNTPSQEIFIKDNKSLSLKGILNIPDDYYVLLYCGSITFNRGLENLIKSMEFLPDCYLVFMGYGNEDYKNSLSSIAEETNVHNRFVFFGPVPSEEVTSFAASADLGVAPIENVCLSYYYCSPNKVFEYINASIPVIASDFPELSKVVNTFNIGTTFNPDSPEDIAKAVRFIFADQKRLEQMKKNTLKASKVYNWENESKKLVELYQTVS